MSVNKENYTRILSELEPYNATLVAVSKLKFPPDILALYNEGQRDFGENYVQELIDKQEKLPNDIRWHFIGHLQSNKVKYIAPFIHLIQGVDSEKLLKEINKQAAKNKRVIDCLLQVHIASEETKFGMNAKELDDCIKKYDQGEFPHVQVKGLMGMASFSDDTQLVKAEFDNLKAIYDTYPTLQTLSMGMSNDYTLALSCGSNMVRIGSLLFGRRD